MQAEGLALHGGRVCACVAVARVARPYGGEAGSRTAMTQDLVVAEGASLDSNKGIDDPRTGCARWPEGWWLRSSQGELVVGRCRATNLCPYCARLYTRETVEMLILDAMEWAPSLWIVLTAREHLTRAECRRHLRQVLLASRRRWPDIQWFTQVEFQRRGALHL